MFNKAKIFNSFHSYAYLSLSILLSKCEERIERKTEELKESEAKADEAERRANSFENRNRTDDEKIDTLEEQLKVLNSVSLDKVFIIKGIIY